MQKVFVKAMLAAVVAFAGISFNAEAGTQRLSLKIWGN